jgi:excinuclease ABC subunit C
LVVDGGKGQLGMAMAVLADLGIDPSFALAGLAKKDKAKGEVLDKIYVPGRSNPLNIGQAKKALYLVERVRDEAHRFAITGHRARRQKARNTSPLEGIAGLGPKRRQSLLKQFGGIRAITRASIDELSKVNGISVSLATKIYAIFHND